MTRLPLLCAAGSVAVVAGLLILATPVHTQGPAHGRLFKPEDLGVLESPDRDQWQQPDRIMDELHVAEGSRVADFGAGGGWFTVRLAQRVGPNGMVYAADIQPKMIEYIERRVRDQGQSWVRTILGTPADPKLPPGLDAVLMVDVYPQLRDPIGSLRTIAQALGPNGRLGIVDFKKDGAGGPGPPLEERMDPEQIRQDARQAQLVLRATGTFLRYQYLLVFGKDDARR